MKALKTILICAAFVGCASTYSSSRRDPAAGNWRGVLERDGWPEAMAFRIENADGAWRGEWQLAGVSQPLQNVEVSGDNVRFETDKLLFAGRLQGSTLSGSVARKDTSAAEAEFSVEREQPRYSPGSEPSFPGMMQ